MLAERPASSISTRLLAKHAGVHHTLIGYTHGNVAKLLAAAFERERAKFTAALPSIVFEGSEAPPLSKYPEYWRAYVYLALDAQNSALENSLTIGHPAKRLAAVLHSRFPNRDDATTGRLAAAWWALQIGALVFDEPLRHGLSIARRHRGKVHRFASEMLVQLIRTAPDPLPRREIADDAIHENPIGPVTGRKAAEARLVHAAIELLKERAATGVSGRELARRAKVNYGLIHHYFGSKEAVFDAAFVQLHERYVRDMVAEDTKRLAAPFSMRSHEVFLRIWAYRELANVAMPSVDLRGMRLLLDNVVRRRRIDRRAGEAYIEAQASAYCSLSLQLGWVVCRRNLMSLVEEPESDMLARLASISRWFVARDWG